MFSHMTFLNKNKFDLALVISALLSLTVFSDSSAWASDLKQQAHFFENKIRPVLVEYCYECHSLEAGKSKGGLLLDSKEATLAGGDTGPALVAGDTMNSLLLTAIRYEDADYEMPPKKKLPDHIVKDFEKWIADGAVDPRVGGKAKTAEEIDIEAGRKFWSFTKPVKRAVPAVKDSNWPRDPIDQFILSKLEAKSLRPAADADKRTMVRRLYFDLIGLPPTAEQINNFIDDESPEALLRLVDELLASPHFGERWGRHWLDVARFAESSGGGRSFMYPEAYRYRDYVIEAFNKDKPFDQFTREQIAGDLLPYETAEQRNEQLIASGFLGLGPINYEQQDKAQLKMDVADEQISTIGSTYLGMTLACARCHDHKFDPITTEDYYALAGIFTSTQTFVNTSNLSLFPNRPLMLSPEQQKVKKEIAALIKRIKSLEAAIKNKPRAGTGLLIDDSDAELEGNWTRSTSVAGFKGKGYLHDAKMKNEKMKNEKMWVRFRPEILKDGFYEIIIHYTAGGNRDEKVPVTVRHQHGIDKHTVNMKKLGPVSLGRYPLAKGNEAFIEISNEGTKQVVIVDAIELISEPSKNVAADQGLTKKLSNNEQLKSLKAQLKKLTVHFATDDQFAHAIGDKKKTEDGHVHVRGIAHHKGKVQPRGFVSVISPDNQSARPKMPEGQSGRLQLAEWLISEDNPLTARVIVNRVWLQLMGRGIVPSVDEFGMTGVSPSHPALLDHLSLDFMSDWSMKRLIRRVVLSRTYAMSSYPRDADKEAVVADPENKLFWKQRRKRLEAEALRDSILFVSGQLDLSRGGRTIGKLNKYDMGYSHKKYPSKRRSVYVPVLRNALLEIFQAFDFPNPNLVTGQRSVSTLAPQALYLMNHPFVIEASQQAAVRLLNEEKEESRRIALAFERVLGRLPAAGELKGVNEFLRSDASEPISELEDDEQVQQKWASLTQMLMAGLDFRYVY